MGSDVPQRFNVFGSQIEVFPSKIVIFLLEWTLSYLITDNNLSPKLVAFDWNGNLAVKIT